MVDYFWKLIAFCHGNTERYSLKLIVLVLKSVLESP